MIDPLDLPSPFKGAFKNRYNLRGRRDWVRLLNRDDLQVFVSMGMMAWDYGRMGGQARAASAQRDRKGRFI